ncbi:MAG: cytochrome c biogenesis protein CcdA [Acidimicrobiales bacterium]|nr:cytochrome c biogenesis protein CcdA [Acidimicrobiales bacterium]
MIEVDLAVPLTAGLVAAFNPCGFAMLPAYLSYFLGLESDAETHAGRNILRGLVVGLTLTAGFLVVFTLLGLLTTTLVSANTISSRVGYATFGFGILMVPLGIAMLRGFEPKLRLPLLNAGTSSRELPSMFLFGVSYAVVSLSCTAPIFFGTVIGSFTRDGVIDGLAVFIAYAAGMSLVIITLTLGIALARTSVATNMRRVLPYVNKVSGGMLVVAGVFLAIYGWWEIRVQRGEITSNSVVDTSLRAQSRLSNWAQDVGGTRLAMAAVVVIGAALVWALQGSIRNRQDRRLLVGTAIAAYLIIELIAYRADLLLLPLVRTIADVPERVAHWFTDPWRWPVLWEVLAALIIVPIAWLMGRAALRRARHAPSDHAVEAGASA